MGPIEREVTVEAGAASLGGRLAVPEGAAGVVAFAHGSGSSRHSPRNRRVARALEGAGLGTLLFDLLTPAEDKVDRRTRELRFDLDLLAGRLVGATRWLRARPEARGRALGYFGASTGAAAALRAAAALPDHIRAIVSRGGRPDLAGEALRAVRAPTLLIVGDHDRDVLGLNREALSALKVESELAIVPGATHLFEEPGALEQVVRLATSWLTRHLAAGLSPSDL